MNGDKSEWLIPLHKDNIGQGMGAWSEAMLRKLLSDLQERSGMGFLGLKTFRATFAQSAVDHEAPIEAASRASCHRTTQSTETTTLASGRTTPSRKSSARSSAP